MSWMGDRKCTKIQSFGGLFHFRKEQKPEKAGDRCFDCPIERECAYSAKKIYLERSQGYPHWPMSAVCDIEDHPKGKRLQAGKEYVSILCELPKHITSKT